MNEINDTEWRPKVGETVVISGTVDDFEPNSRTGYRVRHDGGNVYSWYAADELSPIPASPEPRKPWLVLRDAVDALKSAGYHPLHYETLLHIADQIEAAAAPKQPTLAEAVRAVIDKGVICEAASEALLEEALAREPRA